MTSSFAGYFFLLVLLNALLNTLERNNKQQGGKKLIAVQCDNGPGPVVPKSRVLQASVPSLKSR